MSQLSETTVRIQGSPRSLRRIVEGLINQADSNGVIVTEIPGRQNQICSDTPIWELVDEDVAMKLIPLGICRLEDFLCQVEDWAAGMFMGIKEPSAADLFFEKVRQAGLSFAQEPK
jgi:hypothetical protein